MHEHEILTFLLASLVLLFAGIYRKDVRQLPGARWLVASYFALWCAWLATNVEHLLFPLFFNAMEHLAYLASSFLLAAWCWTILRSRQTNV